MTHKEFNQLRHTVKTLPPEQMRQLRDDIDRALAHAGPPAEERPRKRPPHPPGKGVKRTKATPAAKQPMTKEEFHRHLMEIGLISQLPNPAEDIDDDDPEDQPIVIEGEPLSETIIRERR
jgi:hypothetical protein